MDHKPVRRWQLAGLVLAALVLLGTLAWRTLQTPSDASEPAAAPTSALAAGASDTAAAATPAGGAADSVPLPLTPQDLAFLDQLRAKFAPHIERRHARIKALEQLIAYLQAHYPDDWRARVRGFLERLFPELAAALFADFEALLRHNEWLAAHREALLAMSPQDRRAALWAARHEAFGAAADEIWAEARRSERLSDALQALELALDQTPDEKLDSFLGAIEQTYGEDAPRLLAQRQTELMNRFLEVGAVQRDLQAMAPAERSATLRRIRAGMGMDEAALARWDTLDRERDQAWSVGSGYMAERERILAAAQGAERERQLAALRSRIFGAEAETIASEEAAGFYRYGGDRRYGRE